MKITDITVRDIRFPTSQHQEGSDALNLGDYSATYVVLATGTGLEGHGLTFTNGRGNEIVVVGPDRRLMMDANQCWDVDEAIVQTKALARFDPWWIEEPTSPDDVLGHARIASAIAPIAVATGEACQNRVLFKQFLQADALRYVQVDSCRMGGVNEALVVILMAHKFGKPVCPHAGGVGLCEYVQHLSIFDYVAVSGSLQDRVCEYVDHLHEHFVDPCVIRNARYVTPPRPGYSIDIKPSSIADYEFPSGRVWTRDAG
jgi:L-fuconate dehydratase